MKSSVRFSPNYAWRPSDLLKNEDCWKFHLEEENKLAMRDFSSNSLAKANFNIRLSHGLAVPNKAFPIFANAIQAVQKRFGFAVIKNLPVDYPEDVLATLLMAIGNSIGSLMPQNPQGELLSFVTDLSSGKKEIRGYLSNLNLPFHSDTADILALLCVRTAKKGGLNSLVSSNTIYETILENEPKHMPLLERGFRYTYPEDMDRQSNYIPVFSSMQKYRSCRYLRSFIELNASLSDQEYEALDAFDRAATSPLNVFSLKVEPGDLLLVNNYTLLHSRTEFEDFTSPSDRRMLQRLWINIDDFRPLHPELATLSRRFCTELAAEAS